MSVTAVLGSQWGDEGKGKLVDILGESHEIIVRAGGGANAGHTIVRDNKKYIFHLLPSGLLTEKNIGVIGNGCVVDIEKLLEEISTLESNGLDLEKRIILSDRAHIIFPYHKKIDEIEENERNENPIGTTKRGIGPCYAEKISRRGIRAIDLLNVEKLKTKFLEIKKNLKKRYSINLTNEDIEKYISNSERVVKYIKNTTAFLDDCIKNKKNILMEGAQAFFLDVDFGTYPFVTSSNITLGSLSTGSGIAPQKFTEVIGVLKSYTTRVGFGGFPSELTNEMGEILQSVGKEFGATTGRKRRCGWLDLVMLKDFIRVNSPNFWNLTKFDILNNFEKIGVVTSYALDGKEIKELPSDTDSIEKIQPILTYFDGWKEDVSKIKSYDDFPVNAKKYIEFIEDYTGVKIKYIGTGAGNKDLIIRNF